MLTSAKTLKLNEKMFELAKKIMLGEAPEGGQNGDPSVKKEVVDTEEQKAGEGISAPSNETSTQDKRGVGKGNEGDISPKSSDAAGNGGKAEVFGRNGAGAGSSGVKTPGQENAGKLVVDGGKPLAETWTKRFGPKNIKMALAEMASGGTNGVAEVKKKVTETSSQKAGEDIKAPGSVTAKQEPFAVGKDNKPSESDNPLAESKKTAEVKKETCQYCHGKGCKVCGNSGKITTVGFKNKALKEEETLEESSTRKHFKAIAGMVAGLKDSKEKQNIANQHATFFASQNPRFDHEKFHAACGTNCPPEHVKKKLTEGSWGPKLDNSWEHKDYNVAGDVKYAGHVGGQHRYVATNHHGETRVHSHTNQDKAKRAAHEYAGKPLTEDSKYHAYTMGQYHSHVGKEKTNPHKPGSDEHKEYERGYEVDQDAKRGVYTEEPQKNTGYVGDPTSISGSIGRIGMEEEVSSFQIMTEEEAKQKLKDGTDVEPGKIKYLGQSGGVHAYSAKSTGGAYAYVRHTHKVKAYRMAATHAGMNQIAEGDADSMDADPNGTSLATAKGQDLKETLPTDASASDYIDDFVHSKNKKFSGDSKKQRIRRALGAFYHKEEVEVIDETLAPGDIENGTTKYRGYSNNKGIATHYSMSKNKSGEVKHHTGLTKGTVMVKAKSHAIKEEVEVLNEVWGTGGPKKKMVFFSKMKPGTHEYAGTRKDAYMAFTGHPDEHVYMSKDNKGDTKYHFHKEKEEAEKLAKAHALNEGNNSVSDRLAEIRKRSQTPEAQAKAKKMQKLINKFKKAPAPFATPPQKKSVWNIHEDTMDNLKKKDSDKDVGVQKNPFPPKKDDGNPNGSHDGTPNNNTTQKAKDDTTPKANKPVVNPNDEATIPIGKKKDKLVVNPVQDTRDLSASPVSPKGTA